MLGVTLLAVSFASPAASQTVNETSKTNDTIESRGEVVDVVVYPDRAAVTRQVDLELGSGRYVVRVIGLPAGLDSQSVRAFAGPGASIDGVEVLPVRNRSLFTTDQPVYMERRQALAAEIAGIDQEMEVLRKQGELFDAIAERTAQGVAGDLGGGEVDLDELTRVSEYLAEQQRKLLSSRQGLEARRLEASDELATIDSDWARRIAEDATILAAEITLSVTELAESTTRVSLAYLVTDAGWTPSYTIRATPEDGQARVDYEALVRQSSGEDWINTALTLSTGEAIVPTRPPSLDPLYMRATKAGSAPSSRDADEVFSGVLGGRTPDTNKVSAPLTSYRSPGRVSIRSAAPEAARIRMLSLSSRPDFHYVAAPLLSEHAYLRGTITNTSRAHFLPGEAAVFLGDEYAGATRLPHVAPEEKFELFFGADDRVTAHRVIRRERTRNTGLLGDGRETTTDIRLSLRNETGRPIELELWDRIPVSRDDRVRLSVTDMSDPLTDDKVYRDEIRPLGLLRWDVRLGVDPADRATRIDYTVMVNHKKDVEPVLPSR